MKFVCVCGARPNFMKIAPLVDALNRTPGVETILVHTGQHYDEKMSNLFFGDLGIPEPDVNLEVGSASHAAQTAEIMKRFEPICVEHKPDCVVVVGDVNSTIACALVAAKLKIKVAHVEAGLRSFDRAMPEEINRMLTDTISDYLFVTEPSGVENLKREGVADDKIHLVGNVMIDTLLKCKDRAEKSDVLTRFKLESKRYVAMTLHRPSNVDHEETLSSIMQAMTKISETMPVVFPVHPRARKHLSKVGFGENHNNKNILLVEPLGYLDFMKLVANAAMVLTDSGGIQEETTILNVPCLTLRENTERPITLSEGTNRLVGSAKADILSAFGEVLAHPPSVEKPPQGWDGQAAERIVKILCSS